MKYKYFWMHIVALSIVTPLLSSCKGEPAHTKIEPARVDHIDGSALSRVIFTEKAMQRIDVQTTPATEAVVTRKPPRGSKITPAESNEMRMTIPYSAVLYDLDGKTWVYISPEPRTFVRQEVIVDFIEGDQVVLFEGLSAGTEVVSVGATELFGTEHGMGH